ncbi:MAG: DUF1852 family protein [Quadrisphaera sp.]
MADEFTFSITTTRFDEDYAPSSSSRITTNFANLARGEQRQQNLRRALTMIDRRFNDLADWDNPEQDRYTVEADIVSVELAFTADAAGRRFPLFEVLDLHVLDRWTGERRHGTVGNNFSSYVRDYDFSVRLPALSAGAPGSAVPRRLRRPAREAVPGVPRLRPVPGALPADARDLHQRLDEPHLPPDRQPPPPSSAWSTARTITP